jgi:hypothetical protein
MRQYDASLFAHAVNVCVLRSSSGKPGFDKPRLECLGVGAMLHDVRQVATAAQPAA